MNRCIPYFFLLLVSVTLKLGAQGTAFNYQGRLDEAGTPANGSYDLRFAVYDAVTNGNRISVSLTNAAVGVSNGLFSVTLDFGAGIFSGSNCWLDLGVRAITVTNFTPLFPRQPVLPVPYAIFATGASNLLGTLAATKLVGTLPSAQISGSYSGAVNFSNATNTFSGAFTGNGAALTNLNATQLTTGTVADARLSANVALLNASQTFTGTNVFNGPLTDNGTNQFNGVNAFTNLGNSFSGSFFGNGLVGWIPVYGTATNAVFDHGYLLLNAGVTTVTLPASGAIAVGDIVRIAGAKGGWLAKLNAGQSIIGNLLDYDNGTLAGFSVPTANGRGVAASADGVKMYAVGGDINGVWGSFNSGRTWAQVNNNSLPSGSYTSVACSANGKTVYAQPASGNIFKSSDGGVNWTDTGTAGSTTFIACTADGATLITGNVACSGNGTYRAKLASGVITISTNGGINFPINVIAPAANVNCLAASSDCTRLVAGVNSGLLYATANMGTNWTALTVTNVVWSGAWLSPDGTKLAATISSGSSNGGIFAGAVSPQPNAVTTNSITGSQGSAVELQYIGNNQFMPVSATGPLWAN